MCNGCIIICEIPFKRSNFFNCIVIIFYFLLYLSPKQNLLSQKVERPTLSDREQYLLQLIDDGKLDQISEMKSVFSKEKTKKCPALKISNRCIRMINLFKNNFSYLKYLFIDFFHYVFTLYIIR